MRKTNFKLSDVKDDLYNLRHNGVKRGEWVGLPTLSDYYSMKRGSTTYIYAGAHAGKSQFTWEMVMSVAQYSRLEVRYLLTRDRFSCRGV